ncbi:MAG: type II toxin-antitoxin system HicA family toxin [Deltaproteobacteria bacterium]|nr:type II toxin-antitoxin system HicA family toxin [Deltaproteobacteria bacterium]
MRRDDLERHLRRGGCSFVRHGAGHDIWRNAAGTKQASVPRHRTIADGTVRAICRQLGVPPP